MLLELARGALRGRHSQCSKLRCRGLSRCSDTPWVGLSEPWWTGPILAIEMYHMLPRLPTITQNTFAMNPMLYCASHASARSARPGIRQGTKSIASVALRPLYREPGAGRMMTEWRYWYKSITNRKHCKWKHNSHYLRCSE